MRFRDRVDAGRHLAKVVQRADIGGSDVVVLGLPRGGVPVAFEVAQALGAPLDVIVVRKLGVPFQPELAMGAIGEGGVRVVNEEVVRSSGLGIDDIEAVERRERVELERRARQYRGDRPRLSLRDRCAVVVDDGVATGSTARAACQVARAHGAARIVLAAPVASRLAVLALRDVCDEVLCVDVPESFYAVGEWYRDFSQTTDEQVVELLQLAADRDDAMTPDPPDDGVLVHDEEVGIPWGEVTLSGRLTVPARPLGTVIFAHGSGSSRHSPRNRYVASVLNRAGLATLLIDLLTVEEESDRSCVFDVRTLADRLGAATRWAEGRPDVAGPVGFFGASTGAAAALWAAAQPDCDVRAVVSRGGRPDLAGPLLPAVTAPTLLIVGECDGTVLDLNRSAQAQLRCVNHLTIVPGATHLFEEPGTLESVARLACDWFVKEFQEGSAMPPRAP
ncbi:MAG: phosphoribosyltransferase family protein [Acidimicrobiales bacterium]|jgi:putative phosphoribosyl transferase